MNISIIASALSIAASLAAFISIMVSLRTRKETQNAIGEIEQRINVKQSGGISVSGCRISGNKKSGININ